MITGHFINNPAYKLRKINFIMFDTAKSAKLCNTVTMIDKFLKTVSRVLYKLTLELTLLF